MGLVNGNNTSMLTKIIALSDIYGLTFDIDQAELINDQRLMGNIFKLIKKTQMILPARSPRRRSVANISSIAIKNRRSKSPNKTDKDKDKKEEKKEDKVKESKKKKVATKSTSTS